MVSKKTSRKTNKEKITRRKPSKKGKSKNGFNTIIFPLILLLLISHRFVNIAWTDDYQNDEGVHALVSLMLLKGYRLYDDLSFAHTPLLPFIGATYMSVNGVSLVNLRFLAISSSALIVLLTYLILRSVYGDSWRTYLSSAVAVIPLALFKEVNSVSRVFFIEPFMSVAFLASIYLGMQDKRGNHFIILSGFFAGTALLLKLSAIPVVGIVLVYLFWTDKRLIRFFLIGLFSVLLLYSLILATSKEALDMLLFQGSRGTWTIAQKIPPLWKFWRTLPIVSFASIFFLYRRREKMLFSMAAVTWLFIFTLFPATISHLMYFLVPLFAMTAAVMAVGFPRKNPILYILVALIIYSVATPANLDDIQGKMAIRGVKLTKVSNYVAAHTNPDEPILTDYMMVPFIANRMQAGTLVHISHATIAYDITTSEVLISVSEREKPPYIIVQGRFRDKKLKEFNDYLNKTYILEKPREFNPTPFEIYRRRSES